MPYIVNPLPTSPQLLLQIPCNSTDHYDGWLPGKSLILYAYRKARMGFLMMLYTTTRPQSRQKPCLIITRFPHNSCLVRVIPPPPPPPPPHTHTHTHTHTLPSTPHPPPPQSNTRIHIHSMGQLYSNRQRCCILDVEQKVDLPVIWDTISPMRFNCIVLTQTSLLLYMDEQ